VSCFETAAVPNAQPDHDPEQIRKPERSRGNFFRNSFKYRLQVENCFHFGAGIGYFQQRSDLTRSEILRGFLNRIGVTLNFLAVQVYSGTSL
jgi:hypothetical protein